MTGRSLLQASLLWRIRDDHNVKIWKDQWISSPLSNKIQSPIKLSNTDANVPELIDKANHCWKTDLIHHLFSPIEVKVITAIPISC